MRTKKGDQMMVEVNDIWKKYPGVWALKGVSFSVEEGKVLGVLGENGAGKSTLFRIIASVTRPSKGTVRVMDMPVGLETRKIVLPCRTYYETVQSPLRYQVGSKMRWRSIDQ